MEPDRIYAYLRVMNRLLKHFNTLRDNSCLRTSLYGPTPVIVPGAFRCHALCGYTPIISLTVLQ